jgi:two-component system cell cycle response regulator
MSVAAARSRPNEFVSLAERMGYLHALRAGFAVVAMGFAGLTSRDAAGLLREVGVATIAYLTLAVLTEILRKHDDGRRLGVVGWMLLADGVYVASLMYLTGGTQSPLRFLAYVHLIAVTLLASYRTGLKIAGWHSLLYFVVFYAQIAGIVETRESLVSVLPATGGAFEKVSMVNVAALWVVALATATLSSVNERELRRQKVDLEELALTVSELDARTDAADIAGVLLHRLEETLDFRRGVVMGSPRGDLKVLASRGVEEPGPMEPGVDPMVVKAWRTRENVLVKRLDPDTDPRLAAALPDGRNVLIVPMFAEGAPQGVLVLEHPGPATIFRWTVSIIRQLATHSALALRNVWLLEEVQRLAETDPLTGVANRRVFHTALSRELSRSFRRGDQVGLLMVDVDHFKVYNDMHGHQAGDEVLRSVAHAIAAECRDFDTVARYGGEEFAVILPGCGPDECLGVADRLRDRVSKVQAVEPVTISVGVATFPDRAMDADILIKAADEALYQSKRSGRNRVTVHPGPELEVATAG